MVDVFFFKKMDIYLLLHTIYVLRILKNAHVSQIKTSNKIDSN